MLAVRCTVAHLDRNLLSHLLSHGCHVFIIPLRLVYDTIGAIVNSLLVSLVDCYLDV